VRKKKKGEEKGQRKTKTRLLGTTLPYSI